MERKTFVYYWTGTKIGDFGYEHKQEIDYSLRFAIMQRVIDAGYQFMAREVNGNLHLFIDNGNFRQR